MELLNVIIEVEWKQLV